MAATGPETRATERLRVADVIERYGKCLELVPADPHFQNITVGLYLKDGICTVWSFSNLPGVDQRLEKVRDQMARIGDLAPVAGTHNQVSFPCGQPHLRLLRFLLTQAVNRSPDYAAAGEELSIKDTKSALLLKASGEDSAGRWVYRISGEGEAANVPLRLRAVVAGFVRYGEMEKLGDSEVSFGCGQRHDGLMRVLLPYSRNVSAVENMLEEEALRGQMTTGTLGFTPT